MKKISAIFICAAILICTLYCSKSSKNLSEMGLEVIDLMVEVANDDAYVMNITRDYKETVNVIKSVKRGTYDEPGAVFELKIPKEIVGEYFGSDYDKLSDEMQLYYQSRVFDSIAPAMNSLVGISYITASTALFAEKAFDFDLSEAKAYLYVFENGVSAIVVFNALGDGAVSAQGYFIFYELPADATEEDVANEIKYCATLEDIEVKKIA